MKGDIKSKMEISVTQNWAQRPQRQPYFPIREFDVVLYSHTCNHFSLNLIQKKKTNRRAGANRDFILVCPMTFASVALPLLLVDFASSKVGSQASPFAGCLAEARGEGG